MKSCRVLSTTTRRDPARISPFEHMYSCAPRGLGYPLSAPASSCGALVLPPPRSFCRRSFVSWFVSPQPRAEPMESNVDDRGGRLPATTSSHAEVQRGGCGARHTEDQDATLASPVSSGAARSVLHCLSDSPSPRGMASWHLGPASTIDRAGRPTLPGPGSSLGPRRLTWSN